MSAFVLGATGFVGREVVRQLCVRGTTTIAHVRPDSSSLASWTARFEELGASVDSTAWDAGALAARFRAAKPSQVYILIGTTRSKAKADAIAGNIYEQVDFGLTKIAVDAARGSETRPRLVYLSSLGANAKASSAYLAWRGKAEDYVRDSGLSWVAARPAIITGERDDGRFGERAGAVIGDGLLAVTRLFGRALRDKYASTTPDVLASALIRVGEDPSIQRVVDGADLR